MEQAREIASEYLNKAGYDDHTITEVKNKIYKWAVEVTCASDKFIVEVSKTDETVLKLEKIS